MPTDGQPSHDRAELQSLLDTLNVSADRAGSNGQAKPTSAENGRRRGHAGESSPYRSFSISVEQGDDEVALVAVGELDLASAGMLEHEVTQARAAGFTRVVLDLRELDFVDATGLRMLISLRNHAKRNAHALTLVPPPPTAGRIFEITGTRALFDWRTDH
jgi:anti-sigma B factor antagonist